MQKPHKNMEIFGLSWPAKKPHYIVRVVVQFFLFIYLFFFWGGGGYFYFPLSQIMVMNTAQRKKIKMV